MKNALKLTLLLFVLTFTNANAQTDSSDKYPQTVTIKVIEGNSFGLFNVKSRMVVTDPENNIETKKLKRLNYLINGNKGLEFNAKAIRLELQVWQNKGFQVKSTTSVSPRNYLAITTIILQKKLIGLCCC